MEHDADARPPAERAETLAMVWPLGQQPPAAAESAAGYRIQTAVDRAAFVRVQAAIGFEVLDQTWRALDATLVPGAMVIAWAPKGQVPVGAAAAQYAAPGWVELGWVAVHPAHRGHGLGYGVCAELTRHLVEGHASLRVWGSTQDHRLAALRIYLTLGFHPLFRPKKVHRWRAVCAQLGLPFDPRGWGWPEVAMP